MVHLFLVVWVRIVQGDIWLDYGKLCRPLRYIFRGVLTLTIGREVTEIYPALAMTVAPLGRNIPR